jgi:hypothetical protein
MKEYRFLLMVFIVLAVSMELFVSCKNEVTQPSVTNFTVTTPVLTGVVPASAAPAGVNTITIQGLNFSDSLSDMVVYFNSTVAENLSLSGSSITVRRPNMHDPAATIRVVSSKAYFAAKVSPYQVDQVLERFSSFFDNITLGALASNGDTLYVAGYLTPYTLYKVAPDGNKTTLTLTGSARRTPFDLRARHDTLFWMGNNREILRVNLKTFVTSRWTQLPQSIGALSKFGDFGSNGYFYTGAASTDLLIIPPNPPASMTTVNKEGEYTTEEILAVRAFSNDIYVASRTVGAPMKIYKHAIGTAGALGARTLVLDMGTTIFSSALVRAISFSNSGKLYITIDAPNSLLVYDGSTLDYFYKGIISHTEGSTTAYWTGKQAYWGNQNYLYMIGNDTTSTSDAQYRWNLLKINMGTLGAPYY